MKRLFAALIRRPAVTALAAVVVLAALISGGVAATEYTSRPAFCTSCHEMTPYYTAWNAGAHSDVSCISCHVDPGLEAQVSHKFVALKEVYNHFTTDPKFPGAVTAVPDSRCLACHSGTIDTGIEGFSHETHQGSRSCVDCHASAGHTVTSVALAEAGILDTAAAQNRELLIFASAGRGVANVPGHMRVTCSSCHDLAATGCANCHTREAERHPQLASVTATTTGVGTSCTACHATAASWAFSHPDNAATCTDCHTTPAEHRTGACTTCHKTGVTWKFQHPQSTATCTDCHTRPAAHSTRTCITCHETGASWKFQHPTSKACSNCHKAPSRHYSGACSACHSPKVAFASAKFTHPGSGATCTNCHKRPSGHSSKSCVTCHKPGGSWRFYHPSSKSCSSCHSTPSKHYGTSCSSCHTPTKAWRSATFSHPRIPGGEHTYKSFACTNCHTKGYSSASCTKCHGADGPDDD
ncbi:MAG: hypothetical protein CVT66_07720 [Actinobacteria bacterium HGW-Actinobacteria-6]|nr:MAG: hypothetical protein CVT66_07720 [Actinobacteria bacterium HGW-Actinobacteria-6]